MTPAEYCREKVGTPGSSFYYTTLYLPSDKRDAITALYAYCREVEEVIDECHEPAIARMKLEWWRQEIGNTFSGNPNHPVGKALVLVLERHDLPREHFFAFIDGIAMNLEQARYNTFDELGVYCYRVGSVVGLLSAPIFEYKDPATLQYAQELGMALRLTDIVRDVHKDAGRNRIYIPIEDLKHFGVSVSEILNGIESENFQSLMVFESERAEGYYERALNSLPECDRLAQLSSLIMAAIYRATLDDIKTGGYHVLKERITLPPLRKLWIAWRTMRKEKRRSKRRGRR